MAVPREVNLLYVLVGQCALGLKGLGLSGSGLNTYSFGSVIGRVCNMLMSYCWISGLSAVSGRGALERVSAITSSFPGLYVTWSWIRYFWMDIIMHCRRAGAVSKGFRRMVSSGLWSLSTSTVGNPYNVIMEFPTAKHDC